MTVEEKETAVAALAASMLDTLELIQAAGEHLVDLATSERVALEVLAGGFTRLSPSGDGGQAGAAESAPVEHLYSKILETVAAQGFAVAGKV